ncbi:MAG: lysophospholipid acyltransferase family protein [Kiritimatiellia bacterium]
MSSRTSKVLMRTLRRPFEWLGVGLGYLVLANLPHRGLFRVCDFISRLMYRFDTRGRKLAMKNLAVIFGDRLAHRPAYAEKIIRRSYRNMARAVGHAFWTCRHARRRVQAVGVMSARGRAWLQANRPAVTVSGHLGCWEIMSQLAFLEGHPMMSVAKKIGTDGMTKLLMKARMSIGQEIVPAEGAFRALMGGLRDGKSLGLLVDQAVSPKDGGIWIRFFGRPVPVSAAPAFFAAKCKVPIIVAWSRPLKDGRYRCDCIGAYTPAEARDLWGMTQRIAADLESVIRRHPSCWVLNYNVFRHTPTEAEMKQLAEREARTP